MSRLRARTCGTVAALLLAAAPVAPAQTAASASGPARPAASRPSASRTTASQPARAVGQHGRARVVVRVPRQPLSPRPIQEILDTRVPYVEFQNVPLEDVANWLADYTGLLVYVRWGVLEDAGIGRETLINLKARNRKLSQILWVVMNEAAGARSVRLAYEASDELLVLSTHADLSSDMVTRAYPVSELIQDVPDFFPLEHRTASSPKSDSATEGIVFRAHLRRGYTSRAGFGSRNPVAGEDQVYLGQVAARPVSTDKRLVELMDLITYVIEPESWEVNGLGGQGRIYPSQEVLIIRNSRYVHELIEKSLLQRARTRRPGRPERRH